MIKLLLVLLLAGCSDSNFYVWGANTETKVIIDDEITEVVRIADGKVNCYLLNNKSISCVKK